METETKTYYNYEEDDESFYDDDENYDGSTSWDDLIDFIIDKLHNNGCKHCIDDIEEFLSDIGDMTLAEWSRDMLDPSISKFTCNYIEKLINQKYGTPIITTPMITTPPLKHEKTEYSTASHELEVKSEQKDNKISKIFTKDLKIAFARAAFQQWKIVAQNGKIQDLLFEATEATIHSTQNQLSSAKITSKVIPISSNQQWKTTTVTVNNKLLNSYVNLSVENMPCRYSTVSSATNTNCFSGETTAISTTRSTAVSTAETQINSAATAVSNAANKAASSAATPSSAATLVSSTAATTSLIPTSQHLPLPTALKPTATSSTPATKQQRSTTAATPLQPTQYLTPEVTAIAMTTPPLSTSQHQPIPTALKPTATPSTPGTKLQKPGTEKTTPPLSTAHYQPLPIVIRPLVTTSTPETKIPKPATAIASTSTTSPPTSQYQPLPTGLKSTAMALTPETKTIKPAKARTTPSPPISQHQPLPTALKPTATTSTSTPPT
jgi:hypothetical protein